MYSCVKFKKRGEKSNNFGISVFSLNLVTFFHRLGNVCIKGEIPRGIYNLHVNSRPVLIKSLFRGLSMEGEGPLTFLQGH